MIDKKSTEAFNKVMKEEIKKDTWLDEYTKHYNNEFAKKQQEYYKDLKYFYNMTDEEAEQYYKRSNRDGDQSNSTTSLK